MVYAMWQILNSIHKSCLQGKVSHPSKMFASRLSFIFLCEHRMMLKFVFVPSCLLKSLIHCYSPVCQVTKINVTLLDTNITDNHPGTEWPKRHYDKSLSTYFHQAYKSLRKCHWYSHINNDNSLGDGGTHV